MGMGFLMLRIMLILLISMVFIKIPVSQPGAALQEGKTQKGLTANAVRPFVHQMVEVAGIEPASEGASTRPLQA